LLDETRGAGREQIGGVALDGDRPAVLEEVGLSVGADVMIKVDITAQRAERMVEAVRLRAELGLVAEVPLADEAGGVAVVFQEPRQRAAVGGQAELERAAGAAERGLDAHALLVAAGDERGARRRTLRHRVKVREPHALAREAVDVGRADIGRSIAAEVAVAGVVGHDEDDVRPHGGGAGGRSCRESDGEGDGEQQAGQEGHGDEKLAGSPEGSGPRRTARGALSCAPACRSSLMKLPRRLGSRRNQVARLGGASAGSPMTSGRKTCYGMYRLAGNILLERVSGGDKTPIV
jgi:hypothetical protein